MEEKGYIDLATLQDCIAQQLEGVQAWVKVELDSCKCSGGHWYLGFIQKDARGNELAKARGIIWRSQSDLVSYFRSESGKDLQAGMEILVFAQVNYDARFGLSLIVKDIDADYTVGQRELQKQAAIKALTQEGLIQRQKSLNLPFLPESIAVISSSDAAGYGDFMRQIGGNQYGFRFNTTLFQSQMQGDACPGAIASCLDAICEEPGAYDLVIILRGGGAESDLFCYDDLKLCRAIALCPVPVITAIGHERDFHIADMVANEYFKTPTAAADFLIDWFAQVEQQVSDAVDNIRFAFSAIIREMEYSVKVLEQSIYAADPRNILKQGYVLASDARGRIIKNASQGREGDRFTLSFSDGKWECTIDEKK